MDTVDILTVTPAELPDARIAAAVGNNVLAPLAAVAAMLHEATVTVLPVPNDESRLRRAACPPLYVREALIPRMEIATTGLAEMEMQSPRPEKVLDCSWRDDAPLDIEPLKPSPTPSFDAANLVFTAVTYTNETVPKTKMFTVPLSVGSVPAVNEAPEIVIVRLTMDDPANQKFPASA